MVSWKSSIIIITTLAVFAGLLTVPIWGTIVAVFLDSERTIIASQSSPGGDRIAQIERMVVGGAPSIVVMVRDWWMPNWYLSGCVAASHYEETDSSIEWTSPNTLTIASNSELRYWDQSGAPFRDGTCSEITTTILPDQS